MKKITTLFISSIVFSLLLSCGGEKKKTELTTFEEKYSYAIGLDMGENILNRIPLEVDAELLIQAIRDTLDASRKVLLTNSEAQTVMREFQTKAREAYTQKQDEMNKEKAAKKEENMEAGKKFLEENAQKEGVMVTETGLQYEVLEQGDGAKPTLEDEVEVHYHGTLLDGTVFDSSVERGESISFPVTGVIPGWTEALQLMNVGSKYKLFIPSDLAYGERGTPGGPIGPNAALIFEVELLEIK